VKNTTEKFHKKYIKYQTKPRPRQKLWARVEAEAVRSRQRQDRGKTVWGRGEAEPVKKKLPRGRLEPRQMPRGLHPWIVHILCIYTNVYESVCYSRTYLCSLCEFTALLAIQGGPIKRRNHTLLLVTIECAYKI